MYKFLISYYLTYSQQVVILFAFASASVFAIQSDTTPIQDEMARSKLKDG